MENAPLVGLANWYNNNRAQLIALLYAISSMIPILNFYIFVLYLIRRGTQAKATHSLAKQDAWRWLDLLKQRVNTLLLSTIYTIPSFIATWFVIRYFGDYLTGSVMGSVMLSNAFLWVAWVMAVITCMVSSIYALEQVYEQRESKVISSTLNTKKGP